MNFGIENTLKHLLIFHKENYGVQAFDAKSKRLPPIGISLFNSNNAKKKSNNLPLLIDSSFTLVDIYSLVEKNTGIQLEFRNKKGIKIPLNLCLSDIIYFPETDVNDIDSLVGSLKPAISIANKKASSFDIDWINRILWTAISQAHVIEDKLIVAAAIKIIYEACPNISKSTLSAMIDDLDIDDLNFCDLVFNRSHTNSEKLLEAIEKFKA